MPDRSSITLTIYHNKLKKVFNPEITAAGLLFATQLLGAGQIEPPISQENLLSHTHPDKTIIMPADCLGIAPAIMQAGGRCTWSLLDQSAQCKVPTESVLHLPPDSTYALTTREDSNIVIGGRTGDDSINLIFGQTETTGTFSCSSSKLFPFKSL